jgi:hypothetical protein
MRILFALSAGYAWIPAPPGTVITRADVDALRAKSAANGEYLLRVIESGAKEHAMNIGEVAVAARYAALVAVGKPETREQVVEFEVRGSLRHHAHRSHVDEVRVEGDEPSEELVRAAFARHAGTDVAVPPDEVEAAVREYLEPGDLAAYLNAALKTRASRASKGAK